MSRCPHDPAAPPGTVAFGPCEPCGHCAFSARQWVADGRLRWASRRDCGACAYGGAEGGAGPAPAHVRAYVLRREGAVVVNPGGRGAAGLREFRELLGLGHGELCGAVRDGYRATPAEARLVAAAGWPPRPPGEVRPDPARGPGCG
ncbi:hypothetical protein [Streptomyces sp. G-G2]|uniref:hypothetical protein n=1 Tax=Streptomyces sp. G-G2 TaxID=3046201 RepID=UPI0024BB04A2|nr:hypothetical protein [Streptomyces sp. G-G2]MDJ0384189.1 hypothetical protein [Streptomyces sp. G-G2]